MTGLLLGLLILLTHMDNGPLFKDLLSYLMLVLRVWRLNSLADPDKPIDIYNRRLFSRRLVYHLRLLTWVVIIGDRRLRLLSLRWLEVDCVQVVRDAPLIR